MGSYLHWARRLALLAGASLCFSFSCAPDNVGSNSDDIGECKTPVSGVRLQRLFPSLEFETPTTLIRSPDDSVWFVTEKPGTIRSFPNRDDVTTTDTFLDIRNRTNSAAREPGLTGMALHPNWPAVPEVYVTYQSFGANNAGFQWRLSRFVSRDGGHTADPSSEVVLISADKDDSEHNGGQIVFHPTEKGVTGLPLLYISTGDSEVAKGPKGNAQNVNSFLGKFLRIDILDDATRTQDKQYGIPADNPFAEKGEFAPEVQSVQQADGTTQTVTTPRGRPEIYSWGHRNPWRWTFDVHDGKVDLWEGEVGQDGFEEVNLVRKAHNYGWNFKEALHGGFCQELKNCPAQPLGVCVPDEGDRCDGVLTDPIIEIPHKVNANDPLSRDAAGFLAASVTGGHVYRGKDPALSSLVGKYVYADFQTGSVYAALPKFKPFGGAADRPLTPLKIGRGEMITSFQTDANGELLVLGFHGGVYRLTKGSCPQIPDPQARSYAFLSKEGILSFQEGLEYLVEANPDVPALASFKIPDKVPSDPKDFGKFEEPNFTLADFQNQFMQGETVSAVYKNDLDLGFWRQMTCTTSFGPGVGGCAVTNWPSTTDPNFDPTRGGAIEPKIADMTPDKDNLGTVTMNVSRDGFVRFYVFGAKAPHKVQPFAVLDGEGAKISPALCTPCHGGTYAGGSDVGAIFREFEPSSLKKHSSVSDADAQQQWFDLNQAIARANGVVAGAATQPQASGVSARDAIVGYVSSMYPNGAPPAITSRDATHIPPSYLDNAAGVTDQYKQSKKDLYTNLVGPYCASCHRYNNTDLDKYDFFQTLAAPSGADVLLRKLIFPDPSDPQRLNLPIMPHAAFQSFKVLADKNALTSINAWIAQIHNPNAPQCEVTFTLRTDFGSPVFDPQQDSFRILGETTAAPNGSPLSGPDPLSGWDAAKPGLDMVQIDSDPNGNFRYQGHASFPWGASLRFKAVVGKNEAIRFERVDQGPAGDRTLVVPNATTFDFPQFDWQN